MQKWVKKKKPKFKLEKKNNNDKNPQNLNLTKKMDKKGKHSEN